MPHIPIPPSPTMTTQQILQKLQTINTMSPQNNVVQKITDLAREQAKIALDELLKQEQEKRKQTILTIENIDKIRGAKYSEWLEVGGVTESDFYYEFTLLDNNSNQVETILLHRRQTSDKRYIMEYNNHTLWVSKDRLNTIDAIIECMKEI
jgi:hypothetical protein